MLIWFSNTYLKIGINMRHICIFLVITDKGSILIRIAYIHLKLKNLIFLQIEQFKNPCNILATGNQWNMFVNVTLMPDKGIMLVCTVV